MRILVYFARLYPWQSLVVLVCLLVSGALEGIGWSAILPTIEVISGGDSAVAEASGFTKQVVEVLAGMGIPVRPVPLAVFVVAAFWLKAGVLVLARQRVGLMVAHVATDLRLGLLRTLLGARWGYYIGQPVGTAANAMASEASRGAEAYHALAQVITYVVQASVSLAVAMAISWQVTLGLIAAGAVSLGSLHELVRMANRAGRKQTRVFRSLLSQLTDVLQAVKLLKATGLEPLVGPLLEEDTLRLYKAQRKRVIARELLLSLQEPLVVTFAIALLFACLNLMGLGTEQSVVLILLFTRTLATVGKGQRKYQVMVADESALWALVKRTEEARSQREDTSGQLEPTLERGLSLDGVDLDYDGRSVLRNLSIEIPAGEITAIIGPSGTGKTTLVDLIAGLMTPQSGSVRVDGKPLGEMDLRRWRHMIGYVPQEMLILHTSVRRNVTLGDPDLSDADVVAALRDAEALDMVKGLHEGLDSSVGERGSRLSGGQRQRIAIARALVRRPRLLILDEATAALDPDTEAAIWQTVARLRGKTTVVAISHQPALVNVADRVYRIEDGAARRMDPVAATGEVASSG